MAEAKFTKLADDIPGAEGPVLDTRGRLFCVSPGKHSILRIDKEGHEPAKQEFANTGGIPAGLQASADDRLWVADMKLGVLVVSPEGKVARLVSQYDGKPIRGCNDCAFDSKGNLYITAPAGSDTNKPVGELFCRLVDGTVKRLDGGYAFCNGLAVSENDRLLVVSETKTKKLWAYDIKAPGEVENRREWAHMLDEHKGVPDGMDYDAEGHLLVTSNGGGVIEVFDAFGERSEVIKTPFDGPSNLQFGGEDKQDLYITEHTNNAIWKTRWHRPGLVRFPKVDADANRSDG